MANIANFRTTIRLQTAEYLQDWEKVKTATTKSASATEQILEKSGRSFSRALGKGIVGIAGVQGISTVLGSVEKFTENIGANGSKAEAVINGIGQGIIDIVKSLPLLGQGYQIFENLASASAKAQEKAAQGARDAFKTLSSVDATPRGKFINQAGGVEEYLKMGDAQRQIGELTVANQERQNALRKQYFETEKRIIESGAVVFDQSGKAMDRQARLAQFTETEAALRAEYDAQVRLIQAAEEKANAAKQQAEAEKETARILKEQKDIADAAASRAKDRRDADDRYNQDQIDFLTSLQDALDQQTMTEEELFRKKIANADLSDETTAKAWELFRAIQATKGAAENPVAALSNVETISTAVGGVKMAGMTTGLDKLAKPAHATAVNTAKVAENTTRMANAAVAP